MTPPNLWPSRDALLVHMSVAHLIPPLGPARGELPGQEQQNTKPSLAPIQRAVPAPLFQVLLPKRDCRRKAPPSAGWAERVLSLILC